MENLYKALDDVVNSIKNSEEYKNCILIKEKMSKNNELLAKIEQVKNLQKKYVRSNYNEDIKKELDKINQELMEIPIYNEYITNLNLVNYKIDYVKDSLNEYFYKLFNE